MVSSYIGGVGSPCATTYPRWLLCHVSSSSFPADTWYSTDIQCELQVSGSRTGLSRGWMLMQNKRRSWTAAASLKALNGKKHRTNPPVVMVMEVFRWMLSVNIISGLISSTAAWRPFLEHHKNRLEMSRASWPEPANADSLTGHGGFW